METKDDVARAAQAFYEAKLKSSLETEHCGEFLLLDIEHEDYEVDAKAVNAYFRLTQRHPEGKRFLMRIGYDAAYRSGYWHTGK